jgi:hypothetical protein
VAPLPPPPLFSILRHYTVGGLYFLFERRKTKRETLKEDKPAVIAEGKGGIFGTTKTTVKNP